MFIVACLLLAVLCQDCKKEELGQELTGRICGIVTDKATGEPLKSAGVELSPGRLKTITDSKGQFEFVELTAGNYTLFVTRKGYRDWESGTIAVKAGQTAKSDVQMDILLPALKLVDDNNAEIEELDFGAADITRTFNIFNDGEFALEWEITYTAEWIKSVSKTEGMLEAGSTQAVAITIDRALLSDGENTTTFHVVSTNGSKQLTVRAVGDKLPVVYTNDVTNLHGIDTGLGIYFEYSVQFNGTVSSEGTPAYTQRGFVYDTTIDPIVDLGTSISVAGTGLGTFSATTTMASNKTYYVRAYVRTTSGYVYGNTVSFKTY